MYRNNFTMWKEYKKIIEFIAKINDFKEKLLECFEYIESDEEQEESEDGKLYSIWLSL